MVPVVLYPSGEEPDAWNPDPPTRLHRFVLGRQGSAPLVTIGMNPSNADDRVSDRTINRVISASSTLQHDGWMMLNLYPERASSPSRLTPYDRSLSDQNCAAIEQTLTRSAVTEVWGAWGRIAHGTIRSARTDVLMLLRDMGVRVFHFGALTVDGQPRHPSPRGPALDVTGPKKYLL